jgi:hypothetical protein
LTPPSSAGGGAAAPGWRADLAIAGALTLLALLVRLPGLTEVPRLTDETAEVATALAIVSEGARPLVASDAYRGPAWAYLLAGALALFGAHPWLPRAFAAVLGALTVGATYLLGRALVDRRTGLVAALAVATAFAPVVLLSHVAWSNHSTPLWVLLAALATWRGRRPGRRGDLSLLAAGVLWGLALQSHPSALAPLLGAVGWWLAGADRRRRLRQPGPWLALAGCLATLSPMLLHNLRAPGASLGEAGASGQPLGLPAGPLDLVGRCLALLGQLGRALAAGPPAEPGDPTPGALVAATDALRGPVTWLAAGLYLAALARTAWRGPRLVAWLGGATLLVLPLVNRNYTSFHDQRYIGLLVPLCAVALGAWVSAAWAGAGASGRRVTAAATALVLAWPLLAVAAFQARETAAGRTNAPLSEVVVRLAQGRHERPTEVFVDKALRDVDLGGGGDPARAFAQLLTLSGVPNALSDTDELRWYLAQADRPPYWLILSPATAATLGREFPLLAWEQGEGWTVVERPGGGP